MNNDFKQKLQEREFLALKDEHRVILKWATGCGKSKMVIDLINYQLTRRWPSDKNNMLYMKVLFVVAERAHINNWEDEFDKWDLNRAGISTDVCCYASLKKYAYNHYEAVVLDEAHHCFSEKRMAALEELKDNLMPSSYIYLLSATLSSGKQDMIEGIFGKFKTSTVTLKDAIEGDILPDPKVYVVEMHLDNVKRHEEIKIGNDPKAPVVKWEDRAKYIYKNVPCIIQCTELQKNAFLTSKIDYWNERYHRSHSEFQRVKAANYGSQRKRFLGEAKTKVVYNLIRRLPAFRRYVCFCASVNQAEMLSNSSTISSRKTDKYNQSVISAFNAKRINSINAVGMITEGMNLTDIQLGIIVQLDGKERLFIQKIGRVLRADSPKAIIFYFKDTQDEKYLNGALENIDAKYVQHINIDKLNTIKL